eukprot:Hpha_TRINITY_DN18560_c0_g1::TRINITY_DN18560_c0_g1_i1::g.195222::m.195222
MVREYEAGRDKWERLQGAGLSPGLLLGVQFAVGVVMTLTLALLWKKRKRKPRVVAVEVAGDKIASPRSPPTINTAALVFMCFLGGVLAYIARSATSIALPYIAAETAMTHAERAAFLSAFFYGYLPANVVAGVAVRHIGAGRVLCAAVVLWSAFTAALPYCAGSVRGLIAIRVATAVCQAPLMPSCYQLLSSSLDSSAAKTRANAFVNAGSQFGVALCYAAAPQVLDSEWGGQPGWHVVFQATGVLGVVWACVWIALGFLSADLPAFRSSKGGGKTGSGGGGVAYRKL